MLLTHTLVRVIDYSPFNRSPACDVFFMGYANTAPSPNVNIWEQECSLIELPTLVKQSLYRIFCSTFSTPTTRGRRVRDRPANLILYSELDCLSVFLKSDTPFLRQDINPFLAPEDRQKID